MTNSAALSRNPMLSWQFFFLQILLFGLAAVLLSKPTGSISGRIAMEQEGFNLYTYNMKQHKVYAIAIGPRDGIEEERGVWVDGDGKFQIDQLPVGEYQLKVRVPGFSTTYQNGLFVEEGKVTALNNDLQLEISEPSVTVGTNSRVFTTADKASFWAHAQGSTNMKVKLYKKDMLQILGSPQEKKMGVEISTDLSFYKPYGSETKAEDIFAKIEPVREWNRVLNSDSQDWSYENFKTEQPLEPGDYFAVVEASNIQHHTDRGVLWFTVTDIGLIVKQDFNKTVVRALDLRTLKPMPGVNIEVRKRGETTQNEETGESSTKTENQKLNTNTASTGTDGFAELSIGNSFKNGTNSNLIVCGFKDGQHAYGGLSMYRSQGEEHKTYFYSDRPIYRLGQTVYFKGICRDLEGNGFKNPGEMSLDIKLEDPDNSEIWSGKVKTNKFGTFNGTLEIPKDGKTGAYQINIVYPDGSNDYERIEIDEYRKPEYKVDVTAINTRVDAGEKAKVRIKATYYFGAPVANAKVKYTIYSSNDWYGRYRLMSRPDYYSFFDDWDGGGNDYYYGGEFVSEGIAQTDASGEAEVEFQSKPIAATDDAIFDNTYDDKKYKVEVEVTDISRLSVLNSGFVSVTAGDFVLFVDPKSYVTKVGEPVSANISAIDYDGHPVANKPVQVQLDRRVWDSNEHYYRGTQKYETVTVTTDKDGKASVTFNTKAKYVTDTYYIVASAKDNENHQVCNSTSVWVASDSEPYYLSGNDAQKEPLTVKLDKAVYKPGETIRAMISAPVTGKEGAQAIVSVEGVQLYNYRAVDLKASATLVEIPVENNYSPNVYVNVTFVNKKRQFFNTSQMVKVAPQSNFLTITVSPDKVKYHPGDMATYTLKAVDNDGKAAANVELSMGVVDESIYAIRPEFVQDIRKFFYSQRNNNVSTICSFPEEWSGGPNKIEPRVRKDFRDTAAWFPNLVTDKNGIATAKFKMPDNLTTWRATVRGVSMNTQVGSILQKTVSTQDLIVRLALPRFFSQGDQGEISAIVHNYSDITQNIKVSLNVSPEFQLLKKELVQTIKLDKEKVARASWPVKILTPGTGKIGVKAIGQTAGDAMETKLPLRAFGIPVMVTRSGYLDADDQIAELPITVPTDAAEGSVDMTVHLASSSLSPVLGNFSSLIDYPYGCTEQTMSKLMPSVVALKMNQKLGVPLKKEDLAKFTDVYKQSMEKLDAYQHGDGGWGWWTDDQSNPYLTALVLEGYKLLEDANYHVDADRKKRGLQWLADSTDKLLKQLQDPLHKENWWQDSEAITDLAKAAYVQTLHGVKPSPKLVKWISSDSMVNRLAPETLSYYTMAFKAGGYEAEARKMYDRLLYLANDADTANGIYMNWDRTDALYKKLMKEDSVHYYYYYSYRFTGVETTAMALRACVAMEPEQRERIENIKTYILMERGKDGWGNTKTTAEVFKAFMEDELKHSQTLACNFSSDLSIAGNSLNKLTFDKVSMFEPEKVFKLNMKAGQGKPVLHKVGNGRLYWTCVLHYYKKLEPGKKAIIPNTPGELKITREFVRVVAQYDSENNVSFKEEPLKGQIKAGETLLMKVKLDSPITVPYTIFEVPLPSGAEVVEDDRKEQLAKHSKTDDEDYYGYWWWNHKDIMDDHLALFSSSFHSGKSQIRTMIRMELPGKFQLNPVSVEGMYTKNFAGYSAPSEIEVVE